MTTRRYSITIKGRTYEVEVGDLSSSPVTVTVDGVEYQVDLPPESRPQTAPQPQPASSAPLAPATPAPAARPAPVPSAPAGSPAPPPARPASVPPAPGGAAAGVVRALMPGRVLRVNVQPGATVARGQALLVMESMKMEQTIASPKEGTVRSVLVNAGDTVTRGQSLIELE